MIDRVELSRAVRPTGTERGTEAPPAPLTTRWFHALPGARRAHARRQFSTLLALVAPSDIHAARTREGLTALERFALVEALA